MSPEDIVYLSGPMTGMEDWNHSAFVRAAEHLKETVGCYIFNPAKAFESRKDLPRPIYEVTLPDWSLHLLLQATAIYMLAGWEHSRGARLEFTVANELGLKVFYEDAGH